MKDESPQPDGDLKEEEHDSTGEKPVAEEDITQLQKRQSELVGGITNTEKNSAGIVKEITDYADKVVTDYKNDVDVLQGFGGQIATKTIVSINNMKKTASEAVNKTLSYFRIFLAIIISCLAIIGVFGFILFHFYVSPLEQQFYLGFIALAVITLASTWYMHDSLSEKPNEIEGQANGGIHQMTQIAATRPLPTHDLSPMKRLTKAATAGMKQMATNALELVPNADKIVKAQNRRAKQQRFLDNFIFALNRYNISLTDEDKASITSSSWFLDDKETWLDDVSEKIAEIFQGVDARIFSLMYYEFFDKKYADKLWKDLNVNGEIRTKISEILINNKLIGVPDEKTSLNILSALLEQSPTYSLDDITIKASNFFHSLAEFKESCISHLDFYGLSIVEKRELLTRYVPESPDPSKWRDDVINYIATNITSTREPLYIRLLIESAEGDEGRIKTWKTIVERGDYAELASILAIKRIKRRSGDFDRDAFLRHLHLAMAVNIDDFSLSEIEATVESLETEILATKYRLQHLLDEYRYHTVNLDFINQFTPPNLSSVESELLKTVSEKMDVDCEVVTLLYYAANGLGKNQDLFANIAGSPKAKILANILLEKDFVSDSRFSHNIERLLQTQKSFNLNGFITLYTKYEAIFERQESFYPFLRNTGICIRTNPAGIEDMLKICPVTSNLTTDDHLVNLASKLITNRLDEVELSEGQHSDLALAATTLFLRTYGYSSYAQLCRTASHPEREFAAKILFQCITLVPEQTLSNKQELMKEGTLRAIKGTVDIANYEYFKSELKDGRLPPSVAYLFSQFKQEVKAEFDKLEKKQEIAQTLANNLGSIKKLLYHEIDEKVVREFLLTQVLSAYLLTVPGKVPGIGFISDDLGYIRQAEKRLAAERNDKRFLDLVQLATGGGKATRIGLVPPELTFEEFSTKFNEVWSLGVELHNEVEQHKLPVPLPCYVVRIFPSSDGLKEIMPSDEVAKKPLEVVRDLISYTVTGEDGVALLSLLQKTPTGKLALLNVIDAIFDSPTSCLLNLIIDQSRDIISKSQNVKKRFEDKNIDKSLLKDYDIQHSSISTLGKVIAKRVVDSGESPTLSEFRARLLNAVGDTSGITESEVEILVNVLFNRLYIIGVPSVI